MDVLIKLANSITLQKLPPKKGIWVNLVNTGSEMPQELRGGECVSVCIRVCVLVWEKKC